MSMSATAIEDLEISRHMTEGDGVKRKYGGATHLAPGHVSVVWVFRRLLVLAQEE
jgi:hypothetical protein